MSDSKEQAVSTVIQMAQRMMNTEGELAPVALIFVNLHEEKPDVLFVPPPVAENGLDAETKDAWYTGIRRIVAMLTARGASQDHMLVAIATEAWAMSINLDEVKASGEMPRPSQSESRTEIVMISVETKTARKMYMANVRRGDDGVGLGPFTCNGDDDGGAAITGAATGFFG